MTWLNPAAFIFLASIPIIIILHSLRYRRRDVQVSTLFLWEQVMREAHGSLGLRRLIQNLPLLLQLLLALLLTAALANPALTQSVSQSKDIVLVLDVSASMLTQTSQGTRFDDARKQALEVLKSLPSGRQMAIIAAGHQPRVVTFFTDEGAILREAITELQPTEASGSMRDAILLALSFTQGRKSQEVVVIGDGAYRNIADLDLPRSRIRHFRVTGGGDNVGITRFAFRRFLDATQQVEVLIAVKNFSREAKSVPLQLTLRRRQLLSQTLELKPGQEEVVVASFQGPLKGVAQAELQVEDSLGLDNRAYGVLSAKAQTWVLVVGEGNYFLEQLLTSLPGVKVNVAPEVSAASLPQLLEANHLLIFNGQQPPPLQRGNYLLINTVPQDERLLANGTVTQPQVVDWEREHPLLKFVDLANLSIEESLNLQLQGGAQSLVDGEAHSLVGLIEEPSLRVVTLGFDLMRSDLPLRVAFPVLMNNLLRWVNPEAVGLTAGMIRAGMSYPMFFDTPVDQISVQDPQGKQSAYDVTGNPWIFSDANQVGVYVLRFGDTTRYLTVNLLDAAESDIDPTDALPTLVPDEAPQALQEAGIVATPLWPYLILGALAIGLAEWYVWCRD